MTESVVDKEQMRSVSRGSDDSPSILNILPNARIEARVSVPISGRGWSLRFVHVIHLGQPERRDERAAQTKTRQVDAFGECASEHSEPDARTVVRKPRRVCSFVRAPCGMQLVDDEASSLSSISA